MVVTKKNTVKFQNHMKKLSEKADSFFICSNTIESIYCILIARSKQKFLIICKPEQILYSGRDSGGWNPLAALERGF